MSEPIALIDLQAQRRRLGAPLERAILDAVQGGQWVMGPQVAQLEKQLAAFAGVKHCIACANGTDALLIVLRAWGIGPGDAVFVPTFTFAASAEVVALVGAVPVFVDVFEDTYNIDPASLEAAIALVKREGKLKAARRDAGRSVRPARGLSRDRAAGEARGARSFYATRRRASARSSTGAARAASAMRPRRASSPPSRSAATATAAPRSPTTTNSTRCCARSACTAKAATSTRTSASA